MMYFARIIMYLHVSVGASVLSIGRVGEFAPYMTDFLPKDGNLR